MMCWGWEAMNRSERREEIKLMLEYAKMVLSLAGILTIVFAGLQWRAANQVANEAVYQKITTEWNEHLKIFIEKPELRPYFESNKELIANDQNTQSVLALADVRLDVEDAILTYAAFRGASSEIVGWNNTFAQ
jgi:hypothetical protein